jgi:hypothetical protein
MCRQPKAVWAVVFACVVAFVGIGLVDPILKPIADSLKASPSQTALRRLPRGWPVCPAGGSACACRSGLVVPFWVGAVTVLVGAGVLATSRRYLAGVDAEKNELDEITDEVFLISQCQSGNAENIGANCAATPAGSMETPLTLMVVNTMTPFGRNRAHYSIRDKTDTGFGLHRQSSPSLVDSRITGRSIDLNVMPSAITALVSRHNATDEIVLSCTSFGFGHRYPTLIAGRPPPCTKAVSASLVYGRLTLPWGESGGS